MFTSFYFEPFLRTARNATEPLGLILLGANAWQDFFFLITTSICTWTQFTVSRSLKKYEYILFDLQGCLEVLRLKSQEQQQQKNPSYNVLNPW